MTRKIIVLLMLTAAAIGGSATHAGAGGWAVTTIDEMPAPVPGATVDVGFVILQHGVHPAPPMDDVAIELTLADGSVRRFDAVADGAPGHWVASVTFPPTGPVEWTVLQGWFGPLELGTIELATAGEAKTSDASGASAVESRMPDALRAGAWGVTVAMICWALSRLACRLPSRRQRVVSA